MAAFYATIYPFNSEQALILYVLYSVLLFKPIIEYCLNCFQTVEGKFPFKSIQLGLSGQTCLSSVSVTI